MTYEEYDDLKYKITKYELSTDKIELLKRDNKVLENLKDDKFSKLQISVSGNAVAGNTKILSTGDLKERNNIINFLIKTNESKIKYEEEKIAML
ncbi:MAG: hypothetical protein KQ78_01769 [Candidatus Izimaplasma bacterium HR2]|nr:MAG: hypothetical protein KQ78_01769 [Candidatus Izimaplasma bacterium HR2]